MKIGFTELIVILIVALVVLGPDKLPLYMKKLGQALREFRKYSSELTEDLKENIITPLDEAQAPLREALEPLSEMEKELKSTKKDIEKSFSDIGKVKKTPADKEKANDSEKEAAPAQDIAPVEYGTVLQNAEGTEAEGTEAAAESELAEKTAAAEDSDAASSASEAALADETENTPDDESSMVPDHVPATEEENV